MRRVFNLLAFIRPAFLPRGCLGMNDKLGGGIPDALFVVIRVLSREPGRFLIIHVVEFVFTGVGHCAVFVLYDNLEYIYYVFQNV